MPRKKIIIKESVDQTPKKKKPKPSKGRKATYRNYDTEDVEKAFKDVFDNRMSIRSAAAKHGVPASTLRDRVQGKIKVTTTSSGPAPYMPKEDEKVFVRHMLKLKAIGYRYRQTDIACSAADYGHYYGKRDISEGPMSRGWIKKFVDRQKRKITYQEYHFRTKCPFPPVPLQTKYYEELEIILQKHRLKDRPHLIYNMSETALTANYDYTLEPDATIFSCVNALGLKLPPFFIFKGMKPNARLTKGGPDGLGAVMSESGCPNSRIMQHYLKDHFLKNLEADEEDEDTHVLLLYDGHKSRLLFPVIKWALEHKIILFVIPPHSSYTVDPYKIANFNPMEICYKKERSAYYSKHPGKSFDRFCICKVASKAYEKVFTAPAIIASFHEAGIYPFKPKLMQKPNEDKSEEVPDFRRKRKKIKVENARGPKAKKSKTFESDDDEDEDDEDSSEEDDISDFLSDSDEKDLSEIVSPSAGRDHSYGACSTSLEQGVTVDGEPAIGHIAEEVCVQSADTQTNHKEVVPLIEPKVESNILPTDFSVESVIEMEDVPLPSTNDQIKMENVQTVVSPGTSETQESGGQEAAKDVKIRRVKHEYMLVKPKTNPQSPSPGNQAGQLIRVESSSSSDQVSASKNMVIKVVEVSQEMYDQIVSGGEIVVVNSQEESQQHSEDTNSAETASELT